MTQLWYFEPGRLLHINCFLAGMQGEPSLKCDMKSETCFEHTYICRAGNCWDVSIKEPSTKLIWMNKNTLDINFGIGL